MMIHALTLALPVLLFSATAFAQYDEGLSAGDVIQDCDDCPELVVIPPGEFMMGTPVSDREVDLGRGEGPQVKINIGYAFAAGRFEVTHGQFKVFVDATGHQPDSLCRVWSDEIGFNNDPEANWLNRRQPRRVRDEHPVGCVSWNDAKAYVAWLGQITNMRYRLLSEAEWEYAARAGTTTPRFWGNAASGSCQWANTFDLDGAEEYPFPWFPTTCRDGFADLAPVGQFKPNAFGLHDVIGNVWEWTEDCWAATHIGGRQMAQPGHGRRAAPGTQHAAVAGSQRQSAIALPGPDVIRRTCATRNSDLEWRAILALADRRATAVAFAA